MSNEGVTLYIPRGDYGFDIDFALTDSACTAFNLSGYTLTLKVWKPGKPNDLLLSGSMSITTPPGTDGLCYYTVASGDFDVEGTFTAEVEGTRLGVKISWQTFDLIVTESG